MNKKALAILPVAMAMLIIVSINLLTISHTIVNATVISTRLDLPGDGFLGMKGKYLSLINLTDTYPHKIAIDSTRSDCPLSKGQIVQVQVTLQQGIFLYHGKLPTVANMTLYRSDPYMPWNGC